MGVFDLFSKRQKRARGDVPDVYFYNKLPQPLRVQIVHILKDAIGVDNYGFNEAEQVYDFINSALCRERGVFELVKYASSSQDAVFNYFLSEESAEEALDVVELSFKVVEGFIAGNHDYSYRVARKVESDEAVKELNERFREHGVGYQFESGELIRVDSEFLHAEAVKPALAVLRGQGFQGANEEFLLAHEHYRHGRFKECFVDSLKAFESTMKAICRHRGWATNPGDTAKALISTCFNNGLVPSYLESQFTSLRSLLESGIPTVRNKNGGHGQGAALVVVPEYMARYALNMTATTVLFLVEAHEAAN